MLTFVLFLFSTNIPVIRAVLRAPLFEDQVRFDVQSALGKYCKFFPGEDFEECYPKVNVGDGVDFYLERDKVSFFHFFPFQVNQFIFSKIYMDPCELGECKGLSKHGCGWKGEETLACTLLNTFPRFNGTDCGPETLATLHVEKNFRKFRFFLHEKTGARVLAFRFCPVETVSLIFVISDQSDKKRLF